MVCQHPNCFEFNDRFLVELSRQSHMGWFGNFLYNTMREREENGIKDNTISLWTYIDSNRATFSNRGYSELSGTMRVDASPKKMVLWNEWFMKWHDLEYEILWRQEGEEVHMSSGGKRGSAIARRGDSDATTPGTEGEGEEDRIKSLARRRRSSATEGLTGSIVDDDVEDEVPSDVEDEESGGEEDEEEGEEGLVGSYHNIPPPPGQDFDDSDDDEDIPLPPPR